MLRKVAFTMCPVTDVARARAFYEERLGLKPGLHGEHGDGKVWLEYDLPEGGCLAITNATPGTPSSSAGATVAFEVEDLDRLIADLTEHGVEFGSDMINSPVCRMRVVLDPDGNGLLLHQLKVRR